MLVADGRSITRPVVGKSFFGECLRIRVDDERNPVVWFHVMFSPEEFAKLFGEYRDFLRDSEQADALRRLMLAVH